MIKRLHNDSIDFFQLAMIGIIAIIFISAIITAAIKIEPSLSNTFTSIKENIITAIILIIGIGAPTCIGILIWLKKKYKNQNF